MAEDPIFDPAIVNFFLLELKLGIYQSLSNFPMIARASEPGMGWGLIPPAFFKN